MFYYVIQDFTSSDGISSITRTRVIQFTWFYPAYKNAVGYDFSAPKSSAAVDYNPNNLASMHDNFQSKSTTFL
jgi:hypothetical protein